MTKEKTKAEEEKDGNSLHSAFKRLKVDPDWEKSLELSKQYVSANVFSWKRMSSAKSNVPKEKTSKKQSPGKVKSSVTSKPRREPYKAEPFLSMDKLTFNSEACSDKNCCCNYKSSSRMSSPLNFATACKKQAKVIVGNSLLREARLKLHHKEKDHKSVIREARLKLIKKSEEPKITLQASSEKLKKIKKAIGTTSGVFGESNKMNSNAALSFKVLAKEQPLSVFKNKSDKQFHEIKDSSSSLFKTLNSSEESLDSISPIRPAKKKQSGTVAWPVKSSSCDTPKLSRSCSQEAKLDEMSVDELAGYFEDCVNIPKKMSSMAEMMYT